MNKFKRGQISLYILIVIIITILFVLMFLTFSIDQGNSPIVLQEELKNFPERSAFEFCAIDVAEHSILLNAEKSLLYNPEPYIFGNNSPPIGLHYQSTWLSIPTLGEVRKSLEFEFEFLMQDCLSETQEFSGNITILSNSVIFNYEIEDKENFSFYTKVENVRIPTMLNISRQVGMLQKEDPDYHCVTCLAILGQNNYVTIDTEILPGNLYLYVITDLLSQLQGGEYRLFFLAQL